MFTDLTWLWPLLAIIATWVVFEYAFRRWGDAIAKWAPGWKNKGLAMVMRVLGIIAAMDPSLFAPIIGDKPWAGLALFFIGQMIAGVRSVTAVPGDNISTPLKSAVALHTLVRSPSEDVRAGTLYLERREDNPLQRRLVAQIGTATAKKLAAKEKP